MSKPHETPRLYTGLSASLSKGTQVLIETTPGRRGAQSGECQQGMEGSYAQHSLQRAPETEHSDG